VPRPIRILSKLRGVALKLIAENETALASLAAELAVSVILWTDSSGGAPRRAG